MTRWSMMGIGMAAMVGTCWAEGGGSDGVAQRIPFSTESRGTRASPTGGDVADKVLEAVNEQLGGAMRAMLAEEQDVERLGREAQRVYDELEYLEVDEDEGAEMTPEARDRRQEIRDLEAAIQAARTRQHRLQADLRRLEHEREVLERQRATEAQGEALRAPVATLVTELGKGLDAVLRLPDGPGFDWAVENNRSLFDPAKRGELWDWFAQDRGVDLREVLSQPELNRLADSFDRVFEKAANVADPRAFMTRVRDVLAQPGYVDRAVDAVQRQRAKSPEPQ